MVITVTVNTALDRTLLAPGFTVGHSQMATRSESQAGGKGINVARALQALHVPVLALGFMGGAIGELIHRSLDREGLPHVLTPIQAESRICTAIVDPATGLATEVNDPGPEINLAEIERFITQFDQATAAARLVVLSGSLPPTLPVQFYADLIDRARQRGVPTILDARGAALRQGLEAGPLAAKPNQAEATELFGATTDLLDGAAVRAALPGAGTAVLAITRGAEGAVLHGPAASFMAQAPTVQIQDTVGAGDCFVAGMAAALLQAADDRPLERAITEPDTLRSMLVLAVATATASTLTLGAGRVKIRDIEMLRARVTVEAPGGSENSED
jgi:1-phosphofructokinase family hexose kinase